jgi:putative membrane protein
VSAPELYPWLKAFHLISVIAWMAGMLYLPRLYVYHAQAASGPTAETFKVMERRLLRAIINPAMIAAWGFGLGLAWAGNSWAAGWFHGKLALLVAMQVLHAALVRWRRHFAADRNRHSARFYRFVNESITVLMILIVLLAVVKPF